MEYVGKFDLNIDYFKNVIINSNENFQIKIKSINRLINKDSIQE